MSLAALDSDNDFGYDFSAEEEELLLQLGNNTTAPQIQLPAQHNTQTPIAPVPRKTANFFSHHNEFTLGSFNPSVRTPGSGSTDTARAPDDSWSVASSTPKPSLLPRPATLDQDVSYPDLSRALSDLEAQDPPPPATIPAPKCDISEDDPFEDDRSPLQRFRSYPRKPLTVTDLNAGAWCELQYWYTLTRLPGGRRTRTAAMRQGSKVHQKLEDEVHTTVKVEILTKEDGFGLRLWNLVQGLRTLRDTGLTRELEVWGMVDDNVVNGVIDGVSYENPNPEFEEDLSSQESQQGRRQSTLTDYFPPNKSDKLKHPGPKIYLTDVKTRGSLAPVTVALLRPAKIQLLLYHKFLSDMAAGRLNFLKVLRRYGLDPDDHFSDTFIAQIGSLHDEIFVDAPSSSEVDRTSSDSVSSSPDFLKYQTLRELLPLVEQELRLTFPHGEHSLGHMLRVLYVHRSDGRELDQHDFPVSRRALDAYLKKYMAWWRGERKARGVDIEEAFKCRTCEFVSNCSWRQSMDEERVRKAQEKIRAARRTSGN